MANLNKSTLFPGGESTGDQRKSMGNSHFFNSRATFRKFGASKGMGLGSTNMRSEHIRTTLKHDLMKSRILDAEMCDGLKDSAIREELFSTSEAVRAPQTEIEFMMRARNAEVPKGKITFDALMAFVNNCGYEFDNEKIFNANMKVLVPSAN